MKSGNTSLNGNKSPEVQVWYNQDQFEYFCDMAGRLQVSFQLCQSSLLEMNYEHDSDALETVDRDHNRFHETVELIRYLCPSNATT